MQEIKLKEDVSRNPPVSRAPDVVFLDLICSVDREREAEFGFLNESAIGYIFKKGDTANGH